MARIRLEPYSTSRKSSLEGGSVKAP